MENIEIMNEGMETMVEDVIVDEVVSKGNGTTMMLNAGVVLAVVAAGAVLVKKAYTAYKAKKELRQPDKEIEVDPEDVEAVAAE